MDMAEKAEQIRIHEALEDAERDRGWTRTREALDELAPEVVAECARRHVKKTRLGRLRAASGWVFTLCADHRPGEPHICMHVAFHPNATWTLLGCHDGVCITPVDTNGPFHPGLRQGFVYDKYRHEADVVVSFTRDELRQRILGQLPPGGSA
ncbi:hypothetical protein [Mycobacterium sp. M26]|uniref:hypothetical protein n=1 Tax=Mycobacterium sp. M26 TaxID=1762962 RepID=UPI0012E330E7|nr:hypothetical protein [Mycobacterium sp. M26]